MTVAVSTMIMNSLIALDAKSPADSLTSSEQSYYLGKINSMLDSWGLERLMCYSVLQESFGLSQSVASYTIGPTGNFNTVRPNKIVKAFTRDTANLDVPLSILGFDVYDSYVLKNVGNTYPNALFYDSAFSGGLGTIRLYPLPIAGLTLFLDSYQQLQSFADVSTALSMPPGYQRAIESNFSIEIAPGLTNASPELIKIAKDSKAAIRSLNIPDMMMQFDTGIIASGNGHRISILTGP